MGLVRKLEENKMMLSTIIRATALYLLRESRSKRFLERALLTAVGLS